MSRHELCLARVRLHRLNPLMLIDRSVVAEDDGDVLLEELLVLNPDSLPNFVVETAAEVVLIGGRIDRTLVNIHQLYDLALRLLLIVRDE